jgi:DNA-binding LytR/AlgR family response regulator
MDARKINVCIAVGNRLLGYELGLLLKQMPYVVNLIVVADAEHFLNLAHSQELDVLIIEGAIGEQISEIVIRNVNLDLQIPIIYISLVPTEKKLPQIAKAQPFICLSMPLDKVVLETTIKMALKLAYRTKESCPPEVQLDLMDQNYNRISGQCLYFKQRGAYHKVHFSDIVYLKSEDNYCITYTRAGKNFVSRSTLTRMEEILPTNLFIRVHRQYLVQRKCIDWIDFQSGKIIVQQNEIPISRRRRKELDVMVR